MSGKTFLTHRECGGQVVIDPSNTIKLIIPSFRINRSGLDGMVFDTSVEGDGKFIPEYKCMKCRASLSSNDLNDGVVAVCQICAKPNLVKDLSVHAEVTSICEKCSDEIKSAMKGDTSPSERVKSYIVSFGMNKRNFVLLKLSDVLYSPVSI